MKKYITVTFKEDGFAKYKYEFVPFCKRSLYDDEIEVFDIMYYLYHSPLQDIDIWMDLSKMRLEYHTKYIVTPNISLLTKFECRESALSKKSRRSQISKFLSNHKL